MLCGFQPVISLMVSVRLWVWLRQHTLSCAPWYLPPSCWVAQLLCFKAPTNTCINGVKAVPLEVPCTRATASAKDSIQLRKSERAEPQC